MRDGIISPFGVCFREKYVVYIFIYNTLSLFTEYTLMNFTINTLSRFYNKYFVYGDKSLSRIL